MRQEALIAALDWLDCRLRGGPDGKFGAFQV